MSPIRHPFRFLTVPIAACAFLLVAGCENMHPNNIPGNAMLMAEGNGVLASTAPHDGTVYVYDVGADRLIYSGAVTKGQVVTVNTDQNKVLVNGEVRSDRTLNQWNKHRIYFDHAMVEHTEM